jgi:hypothetical protein
LTARFFSEYLTSDKLSGNSIINIVWLVNEVSILFEEVTTRMGAMWSNYQVVVCFAEGTNIVEHLDITLMSCNKNIHWMIVQISIRKLLGACIISSDINQVARVPQRAIFGQVRALQLLRSNHPRDKNLEG